MTTPVATGVVPTNGTKIDTITSVAFGSANASRRAIVALAWSQNNTGTATIASVVANGVSLTQVAIGLSGAQSHNAEIWEGPMTGGGTGDVVITWTNASINYAAAYAIYSELLAVGPNPNGNSATATSISTTADVPAGGLLIAAEIQGNNTGTVSFTAGAGSEDSNAALGTITNRLGVVAHGDYVSASAAQTVTAAGSSSTTRRLAVAAWAHIAASVTVNISVSTNTSLGPKQVRKTIAIVSAGVVSARKSISKRVLIFWVIAVTATKRVGKANLAMAVGTAVSGSKSIGKRIAVACGSAVSLRRGVAKVIVVHCYGLITRIFAKGALPGIRLVKAALYMVRGEQPNLDRSRVSGPTLHKSRAQNPKLEQ